jgi:hypothetical protein
MIRWWDGKHDERYWLEATDRPDIGADLKAPETDDSGRENWRYSLFKEARVGDVVLHYDKRAATNGIVGWSLVSGPWRSAPIVWGARGSYAREKGTQPHERPGFVIPLERFQRLPTLLTLDRIRGRDGELRAIVEKHKREHGDSLYFPFELSPPRGQPPQEQHRRLLQLLLRLPRREDAHALSADLTHAQGRGEVRTLGSGRLLCCCFH